MRIQTQLKHGCVAVSTSESVSDFEQIGSEFHRWARNYASIPDSTPSTAFANLIEHDFKFYSDWYYQLRKASNSPTHGLEPVYYNAQNSFTLQYPILLAPRCVLMTQKKIFLAKYGLERLSLTF